MRDAHLLPSCPKCGGPTKPRHEGSQDGVRSTWAECIDVKCGERASIGFDTWLETFRPRDAAAAQARLLTTVDG